MPIPRSTGARMYWPRGRVVGGSSSINALVYCRGMPADFEDWRAIGNAGWGWDDVRPYFEANPSAASTRRAARRPTARSTSRTCTPFLHRDPRHWFEAAARELGLPLTDDFNGPAPRGARLLPGITIRNGRRWSAADAFLRPALSRPNVQARDARPGSAAPHRRAPRDRRRLCRRTARPAASAAPRGDPVRRCGQLAAAAAAVRHRPRSDARAARHTRSCSTIRSVGANLQDHLAVSYSYKATRPTLNDELHSTFRQFLAGVRYLLTRGGPLALSVNHFGGFVRSRPGAPRPDQQLYFNPVTYGAGDATRKRIEVDPFPGFLLCFQPIAPHEQRAHRHRQRGFSCAARDPAELPGDRQGRRRRHPRRPAGPGASRARRR